MAGIARKAPSMMAAAVVVVTLVGVLTSACSDDPAAPAGPATTNGTSTPLVVPPVSDPLDASAFRDAPCDLISDQQAGELDLPVRSQERASGRLTCTWRAANDQNPMAALSIRFQSESGLADLARQCRNRPDCESWMVEEISGYPVIRANGPLESKHGMCRLFVGVADDVAFLVIDGDPDAVQGAATGDAGGPRCDRADRAATFAIQTVREAR